MNAEQMNEKIEALEAEEQAARIRSAEIGREIRELRRRLACTISKDPHRPKRFLAAYDAADERISGGGQLAAFFEKHYADDDGEGIPLLVALAVALNLEVGAQVEFPNGLYVERRA